MNKEYTRKQAEEIVGIPWRRIQFYTDSGLVSLEEQNPGRGRGRKYTKKNLIELLVIKELAKHRIELNRIREIVIDEQKKSERTQRMFEPETYEVAYPLYNWISIDDQGRIEYWQSVPPETFKDNPDPESFTLEQIFSPKGDFGSFDLKKHSSLIIVNITYLAKKLINV